MTCSASSRTLGSVLFSNRSRTPDVSSFSRPAFASPTEANSTITKTSFGSSTFRRIRWPFASARVPGVSWSNIGFHQDSVALRLGARAGRVLVEHRLPPLVVADVDAGENACHAPPPSDVVHGDTRLTGVPGWS